MPRRYGTWPSPITAALVAAQGLRLSSVAVDGSDVYWLEGRPSEGGRVVLVCRRDDGAISDLTPAPFNVRSRVHEYGGGGFAIGEREICFCNFADQRLYRMAKPSAGGAAGDPEPLTPAGRWFYADAVIDPARRRLVCVREDHTDRDREPVNTLVSIPLDAGESSGDVIASGHDFYSTPRLSPDGSQLAWIAWRHPQMPWDGTELWVAVAAADGTLERPTLVAGGTAESIYQPGWSPDGRLYFASDRDGWWKLYRAKRPDRADRSVVTATSDPDDPCDPNGANAIVLNAPLDAEFGRPQWVFGTATWAFAGPSRIVVSYSRGGRWHLAMVDAETGAMSEPIGDIQPHDWLTAGSSQAVLVAGSATSADAIVRVDVASGAVEVLRRSSLFEPDAAGVSLAEAIEFPSGADGHTAHAFYYAPASADAGRRTGDEAPVDPDARPDAGEVERPPLIVIGHGGPATAASASFDLKVQFWTSRGFAVVDVNYGGSSGYGREYRERLKGRWGIVDVADTVNAARYLVSQGKADPDRLIIRGGSAGGYTTLAALTFHPDVFKAGASYYGISDLEVLARDTHKFESRYLETLIGPYPATRDVYRARSPIHFVDRLSCALILFQGLEDKVVPPEQSAMMADEVRKKEWPVAYLAFEGEQHGFRKAETIVRTMEAELFFYGAVFGFTPADPLEPIAIDNLTRSPGRT